MDKGKNWHMYVNIGVSTMKDVRYRFNLFRKDYPKWKWRIVLYRRCKSEIES
jgi:hypothetical protein